MELQFSQPIVNLLSVPTRITQTKDWRIVSIKFVAQHLFFRHLSRAKSLLWVQLPAIAIH